MKQTKIAFVTTIPTDAAPFVSAVTSIKIEGVLHEFSTMEHSLPIQ